MISVFGLLDKIEVASSTVCSFLLFLLCKCFRYISGTCQELYFKMNSKLLKYSGTANMLDKVPDIPAKSECESKTTQAYGGALVLNEMIEERPYSYQGTFAEFCSIFLICNRFKNFLTVCGISFKGEISVLLLRL